jgi:isopentenyl-diphosphate delta-isomerase
MSDRKADHLNLTRSSQAREQLIHDQRFSYEPLFCSHADVENIQKNGLGIEFLGRVMKFPLWVSSMTGGTDRALVINQRLADVVGEFGLGMGLGSCRPLLEASEDSPVWEQFDLRERLGEAPFLANIGIAQVDELLRKQEMTKLVQVFERLRVDGLIIHINPLQEWFQKEGDLLQRPCLEILQEFCEGFPWPILVKEVGQGFGPKSLKALLTLPIKGIEFGAYGGTNFTYLEGARASEQEFEQAKSVAQLGHRPEQMIDVINEYYSTQTSDIKHKEFIISGGVRSFLDGHYYRKKLKSPSIYGQAFQFFQSADSSLEDLRNFVRFQVEGLALAECFFPLQPS